MTTTHVLEHREADLAYDVDGPLPTEDGRPPLMMIGQPMDASGFAKLTSLFPDRTVVRYDPRGMGRSVRHDGRTDATPEGQADSQARQSRQRFRWWRTSGPRPSRPSATARIR